MAMASIPLDVQLLGGGVNPGGLREVAHLAGALPLDAHQCPHGVALPLDRAQAPRQQLVGLGGGPRALDDHVDALVQHHIVLLQPARILL